MTLENWARLAEIIAALGVIVSLLYLAVQVRQSHLVARTQARQAWMQLVQSEIHNLVQHPSIQAAFVSESPSREDKIRLMQWLLAALRSREFEWFQYQDGVMDEAHFRAYSGIVPVLLGTERTRKCWEMYRHLYDPGFVVYVDGMLAEAPMHDDYWNSVDAW